MPSSEDVIHAENEVKQKAIQIIMKRENVSETFAKDYVSRLNKDELSKLTGIKQGGPYSAW
jgi:hypothetical protein